MLRVTRLSVPATGRRGAVARACALTLLLSAVASAATGETERTTRRVSVPVDTAIVVRATVGRVSVVGWSRPDVEVEIVREAPSREALAGVSSGIDVTDRELRVTAIQFGGRRDARLTSAITVRVPFDQAASDVDLFEGVVTVAELRRGTRVRVTRGAIEAEGIGGRIRLESEIGDIHVARAALARDGMIRLRTFNGDVSLAFDSRPLNARILALSLAGTIESSIPLRSQTGFGPRFAEAALGSAEPVVSIDVVRGRIRITSGPA